MYSFEKHTIEKHTRIANKAAKENDEKATTMLLSSRAAQQNDYRGNGALQYISDRVHTQTNHPNRCVA